MTSLIQFSYTSWKNSFTASSVAGLVGFAPIAVDERPLAEPDGVMG